MFTSSKKDALKLFKNYILKFKNHVGLFQPLSEMLDYTSFIQIPFAHTQIRRCAGPVLRMYQDAHRGFGQYNTLALTRRPPRSDHRFYGVKMPDNHACIAGLGASRLGAHGRE